MQPALATSFPRKAGDGSLHLSERMDMGRLQHPFKSDLITLLFPKIRARLSEHRSGGPRRSSSRCSGGPRRSSPRSQADPQENCIDFLVNSLLSPNCTFSATVQCSASSPLPYLYPFPCLYLHLSIYFFSPLYVY